MSDVQPRPTAWRGSIAPPPAGAIPRPRSSQEPPAPTPGPGANGPATAGLIVAVIALVAGFGVGGAIAWLLTIAAGVLSIVGVVKAGDGQPGRGAAVSGIILSVLALLGCIGHSAASTTSTSSATTTVPAYSGPAYSAPSYSGPTYSAPEPSPTPAPPAVPLRTYSGNGDDVVQLDKPAGIGVVTFSCPKCTSNTIVNSDGNESLLVNEIGSYTGKRTIDVRDGSLTTQITIKAHGKWTLTVGGLDQARRATGPVSGKGDDVILMGGSTTTAAFTNRGQSNFIVQTVSSSGSMDTPINEIGSYSGTVPLSAPALVEVKSSGAWTITPR